MGEKIVDVLNSNWVWGGIEVEIRVVAGGWWGSFSYIGAYS
jgi:hypothetical protein